MANKEATPKTLNLLVACKKGDIALLKSCLRAGKDVNKRVGNLTPLELASHHGNTRVVEFLLNHNAKTNMLNNNGLSALMIASVNRHVEVVRLLVEFGAPLDLQNNDGVSALIVASVVGDVEIVRLLLDNGAQVDLQKNNGLSALTLASQNGQTEIVKILCEYGAQVDLQNEDGWSALMLASQNGHGEVINLLHDYNVQLDLRNNDGWSALMSASQNGHVEIVKLLHEYGAQVDLQDNDGWSALMVTSQNGHTKIVKLLHDYGANIDLQKNDGWTALMSACQNGYTKIVKLLHDCGAHVDLQKIDGWTALMSACQNGHAEVVELLHKYGAQLDLQKNDGWSALMVASLDGHIEVIKLLLEFGACVDLQKNDGMSALMLASEKGHAKVVKLLCKYNAQADLQRTDGVSALMIASQNGHTMVVKLLLEYGAQVDLLEEEGWSAFMFASQNGHTKVVKLLHECGAQKDLQNDDGMSALMFANKYEHVKVVKLLLKYGVQVDMQKNDGWSALMYASYNGCTELIELLHEYGAQLDLQEEEGVSALMLASQNGHTEVVQLLLEYGAQVDLQTKYGISASILAHHNGHDSIVRMLEDSIQTKDSSYNNALVAASQDGDVELVKQLLHGSSTYKEHIITTALMSATLNDHTEVIEQIVHHGATTDSQDKVRQTALIIASRIGRLEAVKLLLDLGVQTDMQNNYGVSPLIVATQHGHHDVVNLLVKHNTHLHNEGLLALMLASWKCDSKTVKILLKYGVQVDREILANKWLSSTRYRNIYEIIKKQIEFDEEEQRHLAAIQQAISEQGTLTHTTVHGIILGLARSGKDSLMKRLLSEMPTGKSPSTGVAEKAIQIKVDKCSPSTVSASVENSVWARLTSYDDEAMEMMTQLTSEQSSVKLHQETQEDSQTREVLAVAKQSEADADSETHCMKRVKELTRTTTVLPLNVALKGEKSNGTPIGLHHNMDQKIVSEPQPPIKFFKGALRSKCLQGLHQYLKNHWSLYLSNTGGQMEFQELLPLLVSGPSLFLVTFRLDQDLHQRYEIEYEVANKASDSSSSFQSFKYTSSTTQLETILRTLASIGAVGTYSHSHHCWEELKYKVFIVGTHRDVLERRITSPADVQSKIKEINQTIQDAICKFKNCFPQVRFAKEDQVIFTVNNFSTDDTDFEHIRSSVQEIVDSGFFKTESPSNWLIYNVVLRQRMSPIADYDICFKTAQECGISSHEKHKEALHFMHTRTGTIRYFPIDDMKKIVFIDPKVLFSKVTELIFETFTFKQVNKYPMDEFKQKGIFNFAEYERICSESDPNPPLTPIQFVKLLEHLRIAAPFKDKETGELKYFLPCALSHIKEQQKHSKDSTLPPLLVCFECGYCPMGVGCALIKYLMTNEMNSEHSWNFHPGKVFRNQVSFEYGPMLDTVVLKILPTHIEIQLQCRAAPDEDTYVTCSEVCKAIEAGIKRITTDIKYIHNTDFSFTFYCGAQECKKLDKKHSARLARSPTTNKPRLLVCSVDDTRGSCLPQGWEYWWKCETQCNPSQYATLFIQLSEHAVRWREIGTYLGFRPGELDNIEGKPSLFMGAPKSWLSEMLREWLEWAPGDQRGSTQYATLEALKTAVSKVGLGRTAEKLTLQE